MTIRYRNAFFVLFSLSLLVLMRGSIQELIGFASNWRNQNASHILLIPFISATLLFLDRKGVFKSVKWGALPGAAAMGLGIVLLLAGKIWGVSLAEGDRLGLMISALVTFWLGGFLIFYGSAAFNTARFPLLFLFLCVPIPSPIMDGAISVLQRGSAEMSFLLLKLTGTPIYREGFVFALPNLTIEVAPECSGIRSAISLFILCLLAGHVFLRSSWRWGVLIIAAIPIIMFKNALRIGTLSMLAVYYDPRILTSRLHQEGGIPFFGLGLLLLYPLLAMLVKSENKVVGAYSVTREVDL